MEPGLLHPRTVARLPLNLLAVASGAKSFRHNSVIGSPALNRRGLHVTRVRWAERLADVRRRRLTHLADPSHREMFDELGYAVVENALPDEVFSLVTEEIETTAFPARELKQGNTVTRFITLSPKTLRTLPGLARAVRDRTLQGLMRYAASFNADPLITLHTVLTDPGKGRPDPQTNFHSDTFHATSKAWLFLRDVGIEDGPFSYVPGSHRMTPARLAWEREQSLSARSHKDGHHAGGSFRASRQDLDAMGYPDEVAFPVRANTLIVADTHGFHARQPSLRPSTRIALYASLRPNPFIPLAGPDFMDLPGLRGRKAQMLDAARDIGAKLLNKQTNQPFVGLVKACDPAVR